MASPAWFPWYPSDWLNDAQLRKCTKAQRGTWADILCLLHLQPERGVFRATLATLASHSSAKLRDVRGLVEANVLRGSDDAITEPVIYQARHARRLGPPVMLIQPQPGPLWYSKRMVEDEYKRSGVAPTTPLGESPTTPLGEAEKPHQPPHLVAQKTGHPSRAIARESERESESEGIQGPTQAGCDDPRAQARAPARMCACKTDEAEQAPQTSLTLPVATAILAGAGLQLQPHDNRVAQLLLLGVSAYELQQAARKARKVRGDWMPYLRQAIQGMREDAAQALAGTPINGTPGAIPKDYRAMLADAERDLAEFEAHKGPLQ